MLLFIEFFLLYRFRFDFGFDSFLFRAFEFSMKFSLGSNKYRIECYACWAPNNIINNIRNHT